MRPTAKSLRACEQFMEGLYTYEINGTDAEPALAESCDPERRFNGLGLQAAPGRQVP